MIKAAVLSVIGGLVLAAPSFLIGYVFDSVALLVASLVLIWLPTSALVWVLIVCRDNTVQGIEDLFRKEQ